MRCVIVSLKQYDDGDKVDKHHYYNQGCIDYSQYVHEAGWVQNRI